MIVRVLAEARAEIRAAAQWYESKRRGLGAALVVTIDAAIERIAAQPEAYPLWRSDRDHRRVVVRRFP